ncbi:MAG: hypothetical protein ACOYNN_11670 [Terrimicrobiaceae bacterium]
MAAFSGTEGHGMFTLGHPEADRSSPDGAIPFDGSLRKRSCAAKNMGCAHGPSSADVTFQANRTGWHLVNA